MRRVVAWQVEELGLRDMFGSGLQFQDHLSALLPLELLTDLERVKEKLSLLPSDVSRYQNDLQQMQVEYAHFEE